MNLRPYLFFLIFLTGYSCFSQDKQETSVDIYQNLQRLNFLGSVLYIAAHPDDENTRMISYLSNKIHARTAYLSLTRGDGGQNLIGKEIGPLLGVLRSEELLAARKVDGGEQFFSTAIDFGYSKYPQETFKIWDKSQVLSDMVKVIRRFRPDVIINRFDHRTPGTTHGHHTASAILSTEAYDKASDKKYMEDLPPWSPKRLFYNTSSWAYGGREEFAKVDKSELISIDVGVYYPLKGISNTEIAAKSRSFHRCQGFGTEGYRGIEMEYLEFLKGDLVSDTKDIFSGINTTWSRIEGGVAIGNILENIAVNFDFENPAKHISQLVEAYNLIRKLRDSYWRNLKSLQIKNLIKSCAGLYIEAASGEQYTGPSTIASVSIEVVNRSNVPMSLESVSFSSSKENLINQKLLNNIPYKMDLPIRIPMNTLYTTPYWLLLPHDIGNYEVEDSSLIGAPRSPKITLRFFIKINDTRISFDKQVMYKYIDPAKGKVSHPFNIAPKLTVNIDEKVQLFTRNAEKDIRVRVTSGQERLKGLLSLSIPRGWEVQPKQIPVELSKKGEEKTYIFSVLPPKKSRVDQIIPQVTVDGITYSDSKYIVNYDHIERQEIVMPAIAKAIKFDIKRQGNNVGYVNGAGDNIPESLRQIGYNVTMILPEKISADYLKQFDAIVMGIRAYNILKDFEQKQKYLLNYVKEGGTMIVQYNTTNWLSSLATKNFSPYYLSISSDRVVDENAKVSFLEKRHPLLNIPNKITEDDFRGWVQERGLYFPNQWDKHFTSILAMNDTGESIKKGSLLVASYGEGYYIYTGLSFFRELPAGVPGAYKLFANMLSLGNKNK